MADIDFDGIGSGLARGAERAGLDMRIGKAVQVAGAVMSVALVVGSAWWGYRLLVRDVTGIPVIRAVEGPMRVQPDDPGGNLAAHQGLAVNRIAAVGEAAPPADTILLAPRSADLEAEDMARGLLRTTAVAARPAPQPAVATPAAPAAAAVAPVAPVTPSDPLQAAILSATTDVMTAEAELSGDGLIEVIPASVPGPSRSLRPPARPERLLQAVAAVSPPAAVVAAEIDPATLPSGTRLVQLGAFESAAEARSYWDGLTGRFATLMADKARVIEPASAGGRDFFRLRAVGFADTADAGRFCAAFVAEQADCIPVASR